MSPWEPGTRLLGNLYIIILGTLTTFTWKTWDPCREPWRNLEGTFWEPWGNLEEPWEPWGNLEEPWEPWEPLLGNLGNLYFGTTWEPLLRTWGAWGTWGTLGTLGTLGEWILELLLGNLYLGTSTWEPWEPLETLGTLGEWVVELLRPAPKPLLWLKTPKLLLLGKKLKPKIHPTFMSEQPLCSGVWTSTQRSPSSFGSSLKHAWTKSMSKKRHHFSDSKPFVWSLNRLVRSQM